MTPVAKTGLHCGWLAAGRWKAICAVTPVAKTGLHCGVQSDHEFSTDLRDVTPVAKTGLHCGILSASMTMRARRR